MLSAQKEQIPVTTSANPEDLANVGSFGKVVNSIQGLQQRLEHFSAEDVGAAHDRTQTLLLRLADLQRKLATFATIKESMAAARTSLDEMLKDFVDLDKLEIPEKPLRIQTIVHPNNLIQFPRVNKLADFSTHQVAAEPEGVSTRSTVETDSPEAPQPQQDLSDGVENQLPHNSLALSELPAAQDETLIAATTEEDETRADVPPVSPVADLPSTVGLRSAESAALTPDDSQSCNHDPRVPESAGEDTAKRGASAEKTNDDFAVATSADFDQRLLDDLIKNYGEFAASLNSSRTRETVNSGDTEGARIEPDDMTPPTEVAPERNNLPSVKREGDIDRQLKKIIKDYGEYDLYSRQSPMSLKTGVVAAFLLLALILSGFYYFSPKTTGSQASPPITPAHSYSSSTTEPKDSENIANQRGAPVSDAGTPHAKDANSRAKNRK